MLELTKALKEKVESKGLHYVPGEGSPTSKLWICGEAPGEEEDKARKPFVGKSGYFLNGVLAAAHIDRTNCFVTNVSQVRPPENKWERLPEIGIDIMECVLALKETVDAFKPNVIVALGAPALQALTGRIGIRDWRGYILSCGSSKVIGSFHPSFALRMQEKSAKKERENKGGIKYTYGTARTTLIIDLKRAKEESQHKEIKVLDPVLFWDQTPEIALDWLYRFRQEPLLAFDIETKGEWIDRISFASDNIGISFVLDRGESKEEIKEAVAWLLKNHKFLIAQNGGFDMGKLSDAGMPVTQLYADTMIAHHLIYPEWPHGLDYLSSIYLKLSRQPHYAGWDLDENRGQANASHAFYTLAIWKKLEQELKELEPK